MFKSNPIKGTALMYLAMSLITIDIVLLFILYIINSYIIYSILQTAVVFINLYFIYYILMDLTIKYSWNEQEIIISVFFGIRKTYIPIDDIKGFEVKKNKIQAISLSGVGNTRFYFGRALVHKIGTTYLFVTSRKNVIYLKTETICYAISPEDYERLENILNSVGIPAEIEKYNTNKKIYLHKDKKFLIPFIVISILILIFTVTPFILYLLGSLPSLMPVSFDTSFHPLQYGTGKQFAFKQMTYGFANMIILFCMYYASYFCARYDRKSAYRYIYVSLAIIVVFIFLQLKILFTFS